MSDDTSAIRISKLDAARRQLRTAITLWFTDGDPVAVHALAIAAYEILHTVSKKRDPNRRDLLFDSDWIKDEHRRDWINLIKKNANFFKHADRDPDDITELDPSMNEWLIMFGVVARQLCGEGQSQEESDFMWWFHVHRTKYLTDAGRQMLADRWPAKIVEFGRTLSKRKFYELLRDARIVNKHGTSRPDLIRDFATTYRGL
jgi:hypothetical protein